MPFTPFHFGPGLLLKAGAPRRLSFLAFATAQVAIDLESWHYLTADEPHVHRAFHTFIFGTSLGLAIGGLVWVTGWAVHRLLGRRIEGLSIGTPIPVFQSELSLQGALLGGLLGGFTHTILDAIVHGDVQPFLPVSLSNPFLSLIEWNTMEMACIVAGVAGMLGVLVNLPVWRRTN